MDLSDSFLSVQPKPVEYKLSVENEMVPEHDSQFPAELPSIVGKEHLAAAQKLDPTLVNCIGAAVDSHNLLLSKVAYFWDDGILMRKWQPKSSEGDDWQTVLSDCFAFQLSFPCFEIGTRKHSCWTLGCHKDISADS